MPEPMPFDLWWSPSMRRFLSRHENGNDEHLVWVAEISYRSLRNYLDETDTNPPLPDDAVRVVLAPAAPKVYFPGDTVPAGTHTMGSEWTVFVDEGEAWTVGEHNGPHVEITLPSLKQWKSAVDRATAEREARVGLDASLPRCICPPGSCVPEPGASCRIWFAAEEPPSGHDHVIPSAAYNCPTCNPPITAARTEGAET